MFKFTKSSYKAFSSIFSGFSAVFLASLILPFFTGSIVNNSWFVISLGLLLTIMAVYFSALFAEKGKL